MSGLSNAPLMIICKELGAGLVVTEFKKYTRGGCYVCRHMEIHQIFRGRKTYIAVQLYLIRFRH